MTVVFNNPTVRRGGIVKDGLVLNLDAADLYSYPRTGTTLFDLSGRNNHSTLTNGANFSDTFGGVITTDGTDDFILTPRIFGTGTNTFSQSYCLWIRPNDTAGNILSMSVSNPQGSWNMPPITASASRFRGKIWNNNLLSSTSTYTNGNWYYLCLVFYYDVIQANRYQRFYVNGIQQSEQKNINYSSSGSDNYIFFGQQNPGADNMGMFAGDYGPIHIYTDKALSPDEISQNFEFHRGRFGI